MVKKQLIILGLFLGALGCKTPVEISPAVALADKPDNIVLMIGDGMGLSQVSTAVLTLGQSSAFQQFPVIGFQKTHSANNLITDSAASSTAMATGKKTYNNMLSLLPDSAQVLTIIEEAEVKGWATGMVVTSSIVHATPAAFVSHLLLRSFYESVATELLDIDIDLLIGGGESYFYDRKLDNRNLIRELRQKNYFLTNSIPSFSAIDKHERIVCFTAPNHPGAYWQGRTYLPKASGFAVEFLKKKSENGFFLMVEGSQIDWACHANNPSMLEEEMIDFDKAINEVLKFAKKDGKTLVIVTADHESGGLSIISGNNRNATELAFTTTGHTATMVPVFAYGPKAELFSGIYDNTEIYDKIKIALEWGIDPMPFSY